MAGFRGSELILSKVYANSPTKPALSLYGRSKGKTLTQRQQGLLQDLLPTLAIPQGPINPRGIWPKMAEIWVEIGIGGGEHLLHQAARNPNVQLIGFEPYQNGMAKTLVSLATEKLDNVSLEMNDARGVLERFADASLDRIFILYPDPWPKRRHWKRRIIQPQFVVELARLLRPGGTLRFVSDIQHYQQWALRRILDNGDFKWSCETCRDWQDPPSDHCTTKYEQKAFREKRQPAYLHFVRKGAI